MHANAVTEFELFLEPTEIKPPANQLVADFVMWAKFASVSTWAVPHDQVKAIRKLSRLKVHTKVREWVGDADGLANLLTWAIAAMPIIESPSDHHAQVRCSAHWDLIVRECPPLAALLKRVQV